MIYKFKKGDRVFVLDVDMMTLLGFGTYEGSSPHPIYEKMSARIRLDDGTTIWGSDYWWGAESDYLRGAA